MSKLVGLVLKLIQIISRDFQTIALLVFLCFILVRRIRNTRMIKLINRIPGPAGLPVLGNSVECNVDNQEVFNRIISSQRLFGHKRGLNRIWLGSTPYVFIHTAENAEPILNNSRTIAKSSNYRFLHPWLGNGLLTSAGDLWHHRRKILTPAFHFQILEDFLDVFQEQAEILVRKLEMEMTGGERRERGDEGVKGGEEGVKGGEEGECGTKDTERTGRGEVEEVGGGGKVFNVFPYVTLCTLDIVCETAMGRKIDAQQGCNSEYVKAVYEIGSIIQKRQAKIHLQPDSLFRLSSLYEPHQRCLDTLHSFSYKVINERKADLSIRERKKEDDHNNNNFSEVQRVEENGDPKRLAFLDLLLAASERHNLTTDDIREEVDTFMFEGHDTTSAAICWTLLLIGSDQIVQEKVYQEILTTLNNKASSTNPFTTRSLNSMKYLEACIKEALRLYPSVPFIARCLTEDVQLQDYLLPKGTEAIIVLYNLHRDPKVFQRPEIYDPDRFMTSAAERSPYAYIPFSAGPRNCIGQKFAMLEEKIILVNILKRFKVEAIDRREDVTLLGELILRPKDGIRVRLIPRDH